ncbi:MAG: hypothetical protein ABSH20_23345 [Tepidisphaeraceae bacterium]
MIHPIFTILSAASLLLCLATASLWLRSYYRIDTVSYPSDGSGRRVQSIAGTLHFGDASQLMYPRGLCWTVSPLPGFTRDWQWLYPGVRQRESMLGFARVWGSYDLGRAWVNYSVVVVPYWPLVLLSAICPLMWLLLHWSPRRVSCERSQPS